MNDGHFEGVKDLHKQEKNAWHKERDNLMKK